MQTSKTQQNHISYLWDGNRQLQQNPATHTHTIIYEQDSFEPVAQLIWVRDGLTAANDEPESYQENQEGWYGNNKPVIKTGVQLYHYHNDHLGTPNELTDQQGEVVWYADYEAWGNTATVEWKEQRIDNIVVSEEHLQPIRFQGQHFDEETGLHYNRFRYFDPDMGMFTTRDPIGLLGGNNVFQYAPNPTGWIDPFGLAKLWGKGKTHSDFNSWFDSSTASQVSDALADPVSKSQVHGALRGKGGMHEWFPVSMADKARELGFTAEELKNHTTPTKNVWFQNIPDPKNPGSVLEGPHNTGKTLPNGQSSRASSRAHIMLSDKLAGAKTKRGALNLITRFRNKFTRGGCT